MNQFPRSSFVHIFVFIMLFFLVGTNALVFAEKLPPRIGLDLTVPSPEKQEENVLEEKYHEILDEISITPEAVEVVEKIKERVTELKDLGLGFHITMIRGKRTEVIVGQLYASLGHKVARIEFSEPGALRGYISVVDQEKAEARSFRPVTNQIEVQGLEDMSKEALSALSVADITSYFDFTQYDVTLLETVFQDDGVEEYLLQVEGWQEQDLVQVRVRSDSWIPWEVLLYEKDEFVGKVQFSDIVINGGLTSEQLRDLPKVKEVRM